MSKTFSMRNAALSVGGLGLLKALLLHFRHARVTNIRNSLAQCSSKVNAWLISSTLELPTMGESKTLFWSRSLFQAVQDPDNLVSRHLKSSSFHFLIHLIGNYLTLRSHTVVRRLKKEREKFHYLTSNKPLLQTCFVLLLKKIYKYLFNYKILQDQL